VRRRIKTVELSPEQSGLCGCWRFAAVERLTVDLTLPAAKQVPKIEIGYYAASLTGEDCPDPALLDCIVGHWGAIENGTHWVRDVSLDEDACQVSKPIAARNRVTLCNLAIGLYNLLKHHGKTKAPSLPSWQRSMKGTEALKELLR
jgi:hypothetical protein